MKIQEAGRNQGQLQQSRPSEPNRTINPILRIDPTFDTLFKWFNQKLIGLIGIEKKMLKYLKADVDLYSYSLPLVLPPKAL